MRQAGSPVSKNGGCRKPSFRLEVFSETQQA
jgi:hypothetical protein